MGLSTLQERARGNWMLLHIVILLVLILLTLSSGCWASTIALQWDPVTAPDLAGYRVYYSQDSASGPFTGIDATQGPSPVDVSNMTSTTITGLDPSRATYFAVTAYNGTGVEGPHSNVVEVPELIPPTVSFSSPASITSLSGTVSVGVSASDNVAVARVQFYVNGVLQGEETTAPYVFSWNTSSLAAGAYTLTAKGYDAAGNLGEAALSVTVVKDSTAPSVYLTSPGNNATVSGKVAVAASATDNVRVSRVEFYQNGSMVTAGNVAPFGYSWDTTSMANGVYTLAARAYDAAGNLAQSANVTVTVKNVKTVRKK